MYDGHLFCIHAYHICASSCRNSENVEEALALSLIEDLSSDIITKLKQKVDDRATGIFAQATVRTDPKQSHFSAMLGAATR
jgi:hypothetical protein